MLGTFGVYHIDGARNIFESKAAADAALARAMLAKWQGAMNIAWQEGSDATAPYQTLSIVIGKKGAAKVSGMMVGDVKVSTKGQLIVGGSWCCVPVVWVKGGRKSVKVTVTGVFVEGVGYGMASVKKAGGVAVTIK